jgi:signal transduction histidine kinase
MLHNWPIRTKLVVILVIPLTALAVLSAIQVRTNVHNIQASDRIRSLADFSVKVNSLVDVFQRERFAAAAYVGSGFQNSPDEVLAARGPVDRAIIAYRQGLAGLPSGATDPLTATLESINSRLDRLAGHRKDIDNKNIDRAVNVQFYSSTIGDLLSVFGQISSGAPDPTLVTGATALLSIAQARESVYQLRGYTAQLLFLGQVSPQIISLIQTAAGGEQAWTGQFRYTASPAQLAFFEKNVLPVSTKVASLRDATVFALQGGGQPPIDPVAWLDITNTLLDKMSQVATAASGDLAALSKSIKSDARRSAWLNGLVVALVLGLSLGVSLLIASPMIGQLRRLRGAALDVANSSLPAVVDRLHRGESVDVEAETFPVTSRDKDEIGQLSAAFGTVHKVAVSTAVEQAAMRKSIGDTFLNLARRSQALIHRQLKIIDALERKETDPDELEELFRLDHLATRMRRHAEDLIVLSGSKPARGWRRPVPVKDVIRGAVAEVEDYTRVKVLPVGGGAISGHAVGDVIHMLAELIENATSFSPPHTPVHVSGHEVSNGCAIEVEDRGLGMSEEEFTAINARLANPPPFDLSTSERLGLFVVGRLAERHGIQVRLRSSPYGGTMAIVLVPTSLMRPVDDGTVPAATSAKAVASASRDTAGEPAEAGDRELVSAGAPAGSAFSAPRASSADGVSRESGAYDAGYVSPYAPDVEPRPEPAASRTVEDKPMDDLPVFATVRSSWFVADRDRSSTERRWTGGPPTGEPIAGATASADPVGTHRPGGVDSPGPVMVNGGPAGGTTPGAAGPGPARQGFAQTAGPRPAPVQETTEVGLPKRTRRASLAPQLWREGSDEASPPVVLAGPRSPEEVRSMMTSFQANFGRGLADGQVSDDDDDGDSTRGR